jgi:hypothetical protein
MSDINQKFVYVLVCGHGLGDEPVDVKAVYDSAEMAEQECYKRNQYEANNYGERSDWVFEVQKHKLNNIFWTL